MSVPFQYHFYKKLPSDSFEAKRDEFRGLSTIDAVIEEATVAISSVEQFVELPERNRKMVLDMAKIMINAGNQIINQYETGSRVNYWGLYIVGSRAREVYWVESDLDLLSVGTFYRQLGFGITEKSYSVREDNFISEGFDVVVPKKLPDEYNIGAVDRKYLVRAKPEKEGVLPVDLSVVDLTFIRANLDTFLTKMDVDDAGNQLPRIPLVEVTVTQSRY